MIHEENAMYIGLWLILIFIAAPAIADPMAALSPTPTETAAYIECADMRDSVAVGPRFARQPTYQAGHEGCASTGTTYRTRGNSPVLPDSIKARMHQ